jgi:hypothetical protein
LVWADECSAAYDDAADAADAVRKQQSQGKGQRRKKDKLIMDQHEAEVAPCGQTRLVWPRFG